MANGYRSFSERDLAQMRIARLAVGGPYVVPKTLAVEAARHAALGDLEAARELAGQVRVARRGGGAAGAPGGRSARPDGQTGESSGEGERGMAISAAAERVGASTTALRDWERNGLIAVRRDPRNGYRTYTRCGCRPAHG